MSRRIDPWVLSEDRFRPELAPWRESLFTIGNGRLGTRGAFEEFRPGERRATFVNGLFVEPPGELPVLGAAPDWTDFSLTVDGEPFDLVAHPPAGYRRTLDLRTGELRRTVLWRGAETRTIRVEFRRILSMAEPHLAALDVHITALTDPVEVDVQTGIKGGIPSPRVPAFRPLDASRIGNHTFGVDYESVDRRHRLQVRCHVRGLADPAYVDDLEHPRFRSTLVIDPGASVRVTKVVAYQAGADAGALLPTAGTDYAALADASRAAWERRWRTSDIRIDGDPYAELILRFAAFQLIAAASPDDPRAAIGARLMSGFGYRHHVFWDTDVFVVPYFTVTQPDLARTHLGYRYRGLPGARRKAARLGHRGAFYAWESADTGDEVTPEWTSPASGPPIRIWTGEQEEHITADVAWAADHYWRWTGDDEFLETEGAEITLDGAVYWASRLEAEDDGLHLRKVIGPDEYHLHVDDNFYTNLLAAWHLRQATSVYRWLHERSPASAEALLARLGVTEAEVLGYADLADRVVLRRSADGVWEQHAGFFDLEPLDLEAFEPRTRAIYDLLGEERLQRTAVIKQPDVLMTMALLPDEADLAGSGTVNWSYYLPKTDHGSSLSLPIHALLAARLRDPEAAYEFFLRAAAIDLEDTMGNGVDGIHAACQGGLLQAALFGFAGLGLRCGGPTTDPRLPSHWSSMAFTCVYRGELHDIEIP